MNTQSTIDGMLTIVANRLRPGKSRSLKNQQPATNNQQPIHRQQPATSNQQPIHRHQPATSNQQPIHRQQPARTILVFFWCICVTLATLTGCGAERGTIGAQLGRRDDGRVFIRETPMGLAASNAGLRPGDEITLINGQDVRAFDEKGIHRILSGEVGDPVKLTVLRGEQVLHITLQRTPAPRPHKPGNKPE